MDNLGSLPKTAIKFLKRDEGEEAGREQTRLGLEYLKPILTLPPNERSSQQVQTLIEHTKHIKFFAELAAHEGVEAHGHCVQHISYQSVPQGVFLFHSGDEGSKFYIIISGSVAVLAPMHRKDGKPDYSLLVVLRSGDSFGELALISNKPRAASILTREDSSFAVLERGDYLRLLSRIQDNVLSRKVELLQHHPALASWNKNALQRLSYFFKVVTYKRKQVLFHAGQFASQVFLIKSGDFQLIKSIEVTIPRKSHHSAEVTLISTGEMIGDQEVIAGGTYGYTCICASAIGEVMQISKDDFMNRIVTDESVGCLMDLGRVKEMYRNGRLKQISKLERQQQPSRALIKTRSRQFWGNEIDRRDSAKSELEAEVRKRWNLPHKRGASLAIDKAQVEQWIRSPVPSPPGSPKPRLSRVVSEFAGNGKGGPNHRTWIDLVKLKYFHRRNGSGVLDQVQNSWELSMAQWTVGSPKSSVGVREKDVLL